ncbi:MAG: type II toxin-antitoxin system VapB family antitoxin [Candidatus Dadabacteria bacterium]|nr:type II toxin-antitoxin system VapB family antitoxin [Candidatus Dadabacteria bacterium]
MRITVTIDDELLTKARKLTGIKGQSELVNKGLKVIIERESARRLALLGGSEPDLKPIPRRRLKTN